MLLDGPVAFGILERDFGRDEGTPWLLEIPLPVGVVLAIRDEVVSVAFVDIAILELIMNLFTCAQKGHLISTPEIGIYDMNEYIRKMLHFVFVNKLEIVK
jgi:hypothetical protein